MLGFWNDHKWKIILVAVLVILWLIGTFTNTEAHGLIGASDTIYSETTIPPPDYVPAFSGLHVPLLDTAMQSFVLDAAIQPPRMPRYAFDHELGTHGVNPLGMFWVYVTVINDPPTVLPINQTPTGMHGSPTTQFSVRAGHSPYYTFMGWQVIGTNEWHHEDDGTIPNGLLNFTIPPSGSVILIASWGDGTTVGVPNPPVDDPILININESLDEIQMLVASGFDRLSLVLVWLTALTALSIGVLIALGIVLMVR